MLEFMDYIQQAFYTSSQWNVDNSYSSLTSTAQSLLDFPIPKGLRLHISSLATPHFSTSYSLSLTGPVTGSISYLFSSLALSIPSRSTHVPLASLIRGYRHLVPPRPPEDARYWDIWQRGRRVDYRDALLYGRIFLPKSRLEGLYVRRVTPSRMVQIRGVSDSDLPNGGSLLGILQNDHGKYSTEYLFSTDSALLGIRGLYNFGLDPREASTRIEKAINKQVIDTPSLFSLGFELYYGLLNKSGGLSTGLRFTTLPSHTSFPYTMTLTLNPLMGNLSSTYAVKAGKYMSLCSRFDFNFYSYESGVMVGCELWRLQTKTAAESLVNVEAGTPEEQIIPPIRLTTPDQTSGLSSTLLKNLGNGFSSSQAPQDEDVSGVLKARVDQDWKIGLLWESRFKELLVSVGASLDLKKRERVIGGVGLEVQYSS